MSFDRVKIFKGINKVFLILIGTFVMGCAFNLFYAPNDIVLGGFGGLSMIISTWLAKININIDMYIIYLILNAVLYLFALKLLGKVFAMYTMLGILSYTLFLKVTTFVSSVEVPEDPLICCLYGGIITGVGIGMVVRAGGSTGGGDLLGCIANRFSNRLTVGYVSTAVNFIVILLSIFTFGIQLSLYAIIAIYLSGLITDTVVEGPKSVKAFYVISKDYRKISEEIMQKMGRGVTAFCAEGMFTGSEQRVLLCVVYKHQITQLRNLIYNIDNKAFVFSTAVNDAMGKGFSTLKPRETLIDKIKKYEIKKIESANLINKGKNVYRSGKGVKRHYQFETNKLITISNSDKKINKVLNNNKSGDKQ